MTTPRPEKGPWIIPANEAKGKYIHTQDGIVHMEDHFHKCKLRPDQLRNFKPKRAWI